MDLATVEKLLTTTRTVRQRLDLTRPVEPEIIERCLDLAMQAPTGGHMHRYHFMVVTDQDKRAGLAALYTKAYFELYLPQRHQQGREENPRLVASATYLAEHLHEVPVHVIPCIESRVEDKGSFRQATIYGSILPATWSLMLALRAYGIGSAWTTLHLLYEQEAATLLGIPHHITAALLPVAYFTGTTCQHSVCQHVSGHIEQAGPRHASLVAE
jgi:nitroreductase